MNITLFSMTDFEAGTFNPFTIELDGLTKARYLQKAASGLYKHSKTGDAASSRCKKCGHVRLGEQPIVCLECGSVHFESKTTSILWGVCDSNDIPVQYLGEFDLLPGYWEYADLLKASALEPSIINSGIELGININDVEDAYQVEYLTDAEINLEFSDFGETDNQDWPEQSERYRPEANTVDTHFYGFGSYQPSF